MTGKKKRNGAPHSLEPSHTTLTLPQFFPDERAPLFISVLYFIVMCGARAEITSTCRPSIQPACSIVSNEIRMNSKSL